MYFRYCMIVFLVWTGSVFSSVHTGLDEMGSYRSLFENKRVGIITNHTAFNRDGKYILDVFQAMPDVKITAVYGPEHGFKGVYKAGEKVDSAASSTERFPVYSLYGEHRKPTPEMLEDVDILVFDIQDIGTRYYTYIYTMSLAMEAASEKGIKFIVLDRPNPINGLCVEGNILDTNFSSFVGLYPIPTRHGMTVGELALLFNSQGWLKASKKTDLTVIPMTGYQRSEWYDQTGLKFIKPSPNMLSVDTAAIYPGTSLLEGTNVSEGRGTENPFLIFGAPWIKSSSMVEQLDRLKLPGIKFEPIQFTPTFSKYDDKLCHGCKITLTDRDSIDPFWVGVEIVKVLHDTYPTQFQWKKQHFDHLCGTDKIRKAITRHEQLDAIKVSFQKDIDEFKIVRKKYLLY